MYNVQAFTTTTLFAWLYASVGILLQCKNISLSGQVWAHKTSLTLPHFIVPSQESEQSCICVLEVMYLCIRGHLFVCQRSSICVLEVMYLCVRGHLFVCQRSCICVLEVSILPLPMIFLFGLWNYLYIVVYFVLHFTIYLLTISY